MSVLVNGSPTKEFVMDKGLRQGDPLSLFLFVIVEEGLKGLVSKAVDIGEYVGFNIRRACSVDILQFVDDTLLIGEWSWKQVWATKAPKKVLKDITRLQSNFLWGGAGEGRKIHWVSWKTICLPIEKGGLGLRRIKDFNLAFLNKWRWRILGGSEALWYNVLKARYGDINLHVVSFDAKNSKKISKSSWWMDILSLENSYTDNFFVDNCRFIVGRGFNISFWNSRWMEDICLMKSFPVASNLSDLKFLSIACMGGWIDDVWTWGDFGVRNQNSPAAVREVQRLHLLLSE
ncbi:uncharacterized protein LOC131625894 [Vicia villosa]|uniref:uncharacterized protein LOC131625894 n=1 Tax=Vicia villosa TaxID=3911 RepID=UPI00273CA85A|nr:uncharacterized protein LOC131625894 [Vicia villosa]